MTASGVQSTSWSIVRDGNLTAFNIFRRHYTFNTRRDQLRLPTCGEANDILFMGPGEKLVLLTPCQRALFGWRKFLSMDDQAGVNCAVFRNEGAGRASDLIREADQLAWQRWPGERHYTYVDPKRVRSSRQPGRCFLKAGWRYVRDAAGKLARTKKSGLLILEIFPEWA